MIRDSSNGTPSTFPYLSSTAEETASNRTFTSFPESKYILPSDEPEKERLMRQHHMLTHLFEDRVLIVPVSLQPGNKILDCGTGSGIWLLELANNVPDTVSMHGIDIESRLFPSSGELRESMQFSVASVLDLPGEWNDTFSLVHQRLLIGGLQKAEWPKAVKEIHRVLAAGGWAQFLEVGDPHSGPVYRRFTAFLHALYDRRDLMGDCHRQLPRMLAEAGFENVKIEKRDGPVGKWAGEMGVLGQSQAMDFWRSLRVPIVKLGLVESDEELDQLLMDLEKECDEIPGTVVEWVVVCAQKPA